jgi:multicomponent Na+:H+ antiporter subunit A
MTPSTILRVVSRAILPTIVVFSLFLLLSGHNAPGGGFIGGLVAGAGLVLLWANGGAAEVRASLPVRPVMLLGAGLLVAQATAAAGWLLGGQVLESRVFDLHLPVFGDVHLATPLVFDVGVYLVVVGLIGLVLTTLGAEEPQDPSERPAPVAGGGHR